jgi:hypothetical protein
MSKLDLCDNCNGRGPWFRAVVNIYRDDNCNAIRSEHHSLCADCKNAVLQLDFATYLRRHEDRPRRLELP